MDDHNRPAKLSVWPFWMSNGVLESHCQSKIKRCSLYQGSQTVIGLRPAEPQSAIVALASKMILGYHFVAIKKYGTDSINKISKLLIRIPLKVDIETFLN